MKLTPLQEEQIAGAKELLRQHGFVVQDQPIEWKTYVCTVQLPMRTINFSDAALARVVEQILIGKLCNPKQIRVALNNDALSVGLLSVKAGSVQ